MIVLGLHMGHDASMALAIDGKVIGTTSVERFTRVKKDTQLSKPYLESVSYTHLTLPTN